MQNYTLLIAVLLDMGAEYYLQTSAWADVHPSQLLGPPCLVKEYDLLQVSLEELAAPLQVTSQRAQHGSQDELAAACRVMPVPPRRDCLFATLVLS